MPMSSMDPGLEQVQQNLAIQTTNGMKVFKATILGGDQGVQARPQTTTLKKGSIIKLKTIQRNPKVYSCSKRK